jgi:hypothetical protein
MRRSGAAIVGVLLGMLIGAAFIRRRTAHAEHVDLYFEDGSMLSLSDGSSGAERLLPLARKLLSDARPG